MDERLDRARTLLVMRRRLAPVALFLPWLALIGCPAPGASGDGSAPTPSGDAGAAETGKTPAPEPAGPKLPDAAELIEAHVTATGGREAIDALGTLYLESKVDTGGQNIEVKTRMWWKGGRFYIEEDIPGYGKGYSGYDGEVAWTDDPINGRRVLDGIEREQLIRGGSVFELARWKDFYASAETVAEREEEGHQRYDVELESKLGDKVLVTFDAESKLLSHMSMTQQAPTGPMKFSVALSDYRDVGGCKFAFQQDLKISFATVTQRYEKVEVGAEVDETKFAYPESDTAVDADGGGDEAPEKAPEKVPEKVPEKAPAIAGDAGEK